MKIAGRMGWSLSIPGKAACLLPVAGFLAACSSLSMEDAAPGATPVASAAQPDGYPNLNLPVQGASPQLTASERQQIIEGLTASRQGLPDGVDLREAAANAERLRRLARERAAQPTPDSGGAQAPAGDQSAIGAERLRQLARERAAQVTPDPGGTRASAGDQSATAAERLRRLARKNAELNADEVETSSISRSAEAERLHSLSQSHADEALGTIATPANPVGNSHYRPARESGVVEP